MYTDVRNAIKSATNNSAHFNGSDIERVRESGVRGGGGGGGGRRNKKKEREREREYARLTNPCKTGTHTDVMKAIKSATGNGVHVNEGDRK